MILAVFFALVAVVTSTSGHDKLHIRTRDDATSTSLNQVAIWIDGNLNPVKNQENTPSAGAETATIALPSAPSLLPDQAAKAPQIQRRFAQSVSDLSSVTPAGSSTSSSREEAQVSRSASGSDSAGTAVASGMGICYDLNYYDAVDGETKCKSAQMIATEFSFLKTQGYGMVRVYDVRCPNGDFVQAAVHNDLKLMPGINSITNLEDDLKKLTSIINGNWDPIGAVYIGNELVNTGQASASGVAEAVSQARSILNGAGFLGSVVTVDTFNVMLTDSTVCSTSDFCAANTHAFFDPNTAADGAGDFVLDAYNRVAIANGGKRVVITESGWPWKGSCNGKACPSVDNQETALNSIISSFRGQEANIFMFQAYNADYKQAGAYGAEPYFGIYDSDQHAAGAEST